MSRLFYHVMQDNLGNLLFDVTGTMRLAGTGTLATIYGDEALTAILPNPMTNHPSFGSFKCFLGAGDYDFYMAKGGYTFETLTGVQGHGTMAQQNADAVEITGGNITGLGRLGVLGAPSVGFVAAIGGSLYVNDAVGLKTLAPLAALHIGGGATGTLRVEGGVTLDGGMVVDTSTLAVDATNNRVGIRTTSPSYALQVAGDGAFSGPVGLNGVPLEGFAAAVGGSLYVSSVVGIGTSAPGQTLTVQGQIGLPGGVGSIIDTTSRAVLKRDIRPLTDALALLRRLQPRQWEWASHAPAHAVLPPGTRTGFVVEEVTQVKPEWTPTDTQGTQGLAMSGLEAYLVAAVQELAQQVERLTARLAAAGA